MKRGELVAHSLLVRKTRRGAAGEELHHRGCGEPTRDEALVHPVARDRIDQARGVPHDEHPLARDPRAGAAQRQTMPAQLLELVGLDPMRRAGALQVLAQLRALALPAADADVRVVALGEAPRVAAWNVGELEDEPVPYRW